MNGPYIRAFVTLSVGQSVRFYIYPPAHLQTHPPKWYALHRSLSVATSRRLCWTGHAVRRGCHRHTDTKFIWGILSKTNSWNTEKKSGRKGRNGLMKRDREDGGSNKLTQDGVRWRDRSLVVCTLGVCYHRVGYIQQQNKFNNNNSQHHYHEESRFRSTEAYSSWYWRWLLFPSLFWYPHITASADIGKPILAEALSPFLPHISYISLGTGWWLQLRRVLFNVSRMLVFLCHKIK